MIEMASAVAIKAAGYDKYGAKFKSSDVDAAIASRILIDDYFHERGKKMANDIKKATEITDRATLELGEALNRFLALEDKFSENAKRVTGRIRDASSRLADGLARVERAAALPVLERHCALLERMAESLERLAALESSGKLGKISGALR